MSALRASTTPATTTSPPLEWETEIRVPIGAVEQSYTIYFFLGQVPKNADDWPTADNIVGTYVHYGGGEPPNDDHELHGVVSLTKALRVTRNYERSIAQIERYLRENFHWRFQKVDGTVVDPAEVRGLQIAVMTVELEFSDGHWRYPPNGNPVYRNVTDGKPGGRPNPST